jgi:hypothetical protein
MDFGGVWVADIAISDIKIVGPAPKDVVASFGIRDQHNTGAIPRVLSGRGGRSGV